MASDKVEYCPLFCDARMCADDLVTLSPYGSGLRQFAIVCSRYDVQCGIKFNKKKRLVIVAKKNNEGRKPIVPAFCMVGRC